MLRELKTHKQNHSDSVFKEYCPDFDTLKNFIGYKIYGTNFIEHFRDLGLCFHGSLADINNSDFPFILRDYDGYENDLRYIVFEKDFQPVYRPFKTVNEIPFTVGDRIFIKTKEFNLSFEFGIYQTEYAQYSELLYHDKEKTYGSAKIFKGTKHERKITFYPISVMYKWQRPFVPLHEDTNVFSVPDGDFSDYLIISRIEQQALKRYNIVLD